MQEMPLRHAFEIEVGQRFEVGIRQTPSPLLSLSMQLSWTMFPLNECVPQESVLLQSPLRGEGAVGVTVEIHRPSVVDHVV